MVVFFAKHTAMQNDLRIISDLDYFRLMNRISADIGDPEVDPCNLHRLYILLNTSRRLKPEEVGDDLVTMNSSVVLRNVHTGNKKIIQIVYPGNKNTVTQTGEWKDEVTVYSPVALSVLGLKKQDIFYEWSGTQAEPVQIEQVLFQPESQKLFNL